MTFPVRESTDLTFVFGADRVRRVADPSGKTSDVNAGTRKSRMAHRKQVSARRNSGAACVNHALGMILALTHKGLSQRTRIEKQSVSSDVESIRVVDGARNMTGFSVGSGTSPEIYLFDARIEEEIAVR